MLEKDILAKTYFDTATVYRKQATEDTNGISTLTYQIVHNNIPCALSQKQLTTPTQNESNNYRYDSLLFVDPTKTIKPGDKLVITIGANSDTRTMYAGEPFIYTSHQEVPLLRDERA